MIGSLLLLISVFYLISFLLKNTFCTTELNSMSTYVFFLFACLFLFVSLFVLCVGVGGGVCRVCVCVCVLLFVCMFLFFFLGVVLQFCHCSRLHS